MSLLLFEQNYHIYANNCFSSWHFILFVAVFSIISSEKELKNLKELEDEHLAKRARQDEEDE